MPKLVNYYVTVRKAALRLHFFQMLFRGRIFFIKSGSQSRWLSQSDHDGYVCHFGRFSCVSGDSLRQLRKSFTINIFLRM